MTLVASPGWNTNPARSQRIEDDRGRAEAALYWATTLRRISIGAALALTLLPVASAKNLSTAVAVGADGQSIHLSPLLLDPASPAEHRRRLAGGFLLVYPLMEDGLPARPARVYGAAGVVCRSWDMLGTPRPSSCTRLETAARRRFRALRLEPFRSTPPSLRRISFVRTLTAPNNYLAAIELAFHRWKRARAAARPQQCVQVKARWEPAGSRPRAFCLAKSGAWASGRLYPYPRVVCRAADLVGSIFEPALPECL